MGLAGVIARRRLRRDLRHAPAKTFDSRRMRALGFLLLVGCAGGEGGASVTASVEVTALDCELADASTIVASGSLDVFMGDAATLRLIASSSAFPQGDASISTVVIACGAWEADGGSCTRGAGAPRRQTVSFEATLTTPSGPLPADVPLSAIGLITNDPAGSAILAEDFADAICR
jgi:hypothetical protein